MLGGESLAPSATGSKTEPAVPRKASRAWWDWKPEGWGAGRWKEGRGGAEMPRVKGARVKVMERRRGGKGEKSGEEGKR